MTDSTPALLDAFKNPIELGDEVATITYNDNLPFRGIVVRLGKSQVKVKDNYRIKSSERWIGNWRCIKLRSKEEVELEQD